MPLVPGTKFGPYEIQSALGAGGMGEVYRARDTRLDRTVAVKVLPASFASDADRLRRFDQEARAVAALNHPNILAVHDIGTFEQTPYMVCELLEGETLRERLQGAALSPRRAVEYGVQIAQGLAAAHEKGLVHRDLKPENIFLTRDGRVKILDFGLAKVVRRDAGAVGQTMTAAEIAVTEAGQVLGTAGYMSPEQVRGLAIDHRSDLFAFGVILFEMLSGQRAFKRDTPAETMTAILKEDPPELTEINRSIPPALDRVVRHCMEKSPDQRFQSARDLAFDLESLSQHSGSSAAAIAQATARQRLQRFQVPIAAALLVAAAALGYLAGRGGAATPHTYHQLTFRRGTVLNARFAPDQSTVIYSAAWDGAEPELFSTRQDSIESRPLGVRESSLLSISSGGEMAVSLHPHQLPGLFGIQGTLGRTPLTSGTAPRELMEGVEWADWSPDGSNVLVVRTVDGENRMEYPAGKVVFKLAAPGWISHPRLSHDGKRIAFLFHPTRGDDRGSVAVLDSDGKSAPRFYEEYPSLYGLAWSPNDSEVWYTADPTGATIARRLMAVSLSGKVRLLAAAPGELTLQDVGADGTAIVSIEDRERKLYFANNQGERDLTWLDRAVLVDVSSDGSEVLFHEGGKGGGPLGTIYMRKTDGSSAVSLGEGYGIALAPDQKSVLAFQATTPRRDLIIPTGAGEVKTLEWHGVENVALQGFAADSRRIVIAGNEPGKPRRMFLYDPDTKQLKAITPEGVVGEMTPNGEYVGVGDGKTAMLLPVEGSAAPIPLPELGANDIPVQLAGDRKSLLVANITGNKADIYRVEFDGGKRQLVKTLVMRDQTGGSGITKVRATPDGQSFAYNTLRELSELYLLQGLH